MIFVTAFVFSMACRKPYEPAPIKTATNFLVVDGTISVGQDAVTTLVLSRTSRLGDSIQFAPELNALVYIEQEQGPAFVADLIGEGIYRTIPLNLDTDKNYRLRVLVSNKEYISEYTRAKVAPPIDSLTWQQAEDVTISVHTRDPLNDTRYYRWEFTETWNYESILSTPWGVSNGFIFLKDSLSQTDSCWRTAQSADILVASTVALSADVVSDFPLTVIPQHTEKLGKGYSMLARQYAITPEAFRYLQLIQKNTEQVGTLFDGQPSQLEGNIHCTEDPDEPVIGYIVASTVSEKRLFIRNQQLPDWNYTPAGMACNDMFVIPQNPDNFARFDYPDPAYGVYYFVTGGGIMLARKACLECTELGGTNVKPAFW